MRRYKLKAEFRDLSDEEVLLVLMRCEDLAASGKGGTFFELHPGEREIIESFVYHPRKLIGFLEGFKGHRATALWLIIRLLNRPVDSPD